MCTRYTQIYFEVVDIYNFIYLFYIVQLNLSGSGKFIRGRLRDTERKTISKINNSDREQLFGFCAPFKLHQHVGIGEWKQREKINSKKHAYCLYMSISIVRYSKHTYIRFNLLILVENWQIFARNWNRSLAVYIYSVNLFCISGNSACFSHYFAFIIILLLFHAIWLYLYRNIFAPETVCFLLCPSPNWQELNSICYYY